MRTTLDLPEELLAEAMKVTDIKTKTKVIVSRDKEYSLSFSIFTIRFIPGKNIK